MTAPMSAERLVYMRAIARDAQGDADAWAGYGDALFELIAEVERLQFSREKVANLLERVAHFEPAPRLTAECLYVAAELRERSHGA